MDRHLDLYTGELVAQGRLGALPILFCFLLLPPSPPSFTAIIESLAPRDDVAGVFAARLDISWPAASFAAAEPMLSKSGI